jgi:hypothetical protein
VTTTLTDDLFSHNTVGQSRQISSNQDRSMFIVFNHRPPNRIDRSDAYLAFLQWTQRFIATAAPILNLDRLIDHCLQSIHPAFPVLPVSADSLPPALQTPILATAFATLPEYDLVSRTLCITLKEERLTDHSLNLPRLSSLASALLNGVLLSTPAATMACSPRLSLTPNFSAFTLTARSGQFQGGRSHCGSVSGGASGPTTRGLRSSTRDLATSKSATTRLG